MKWLEYNEEEEREEDICERGDRKGRGMYEGEEGGDVMRLIKVL